MPLVSVKIYTMFCAEYAQKKNQAFSQRLEIRRKNCGLPSVYISWHKWEPIRKVETCRTTPTLKKRLPFIEKLG